MGQKNEEMNPELPWVKCLSCGFGASIGSYEFMKKQAGLQDSECPLCGCADIAQTSYYPLELKQAETAQ